MSSALKLWFFRDLSDEQRLKLFALFGLPVDEIGKSHGRQEIALRDITRKHVEMVRDETAAPARQSNVMSPHAFDPTSGDGCAVCGRGPNYTAHQPAGAQHVPCPCTLVEQDEDCPVGYPSMICGICEGNGHTTQEKVTALACEMIKIASDMGEPEDPFAAWESIDLIKSQHGQLRKALAVADQFIANGIELGYIRMPDPDSNDSALLTPGIVRAALATTEAI
ncbi:MAG: hypothetical protein QMD99_06815 [Rhizobiaceae bacterium]|nr:hypothetical protein [Rhizobiaceae bacterium]